MAKKDYTAIVLVVDRSGSMSSIAQATQEALTEFVNGQKAVEGDFTIDTVYFDDQYEERATLVNPKKEELDLSINPRGMTALYDAVGRKINSFKGAIDKLPASKRPEQVLFVIATDGHENASQEYRAETIRDLIKHQQEIEEWKFTFIGANQDAVLTAQTLNIAAQDAITFNASEMGTKSVIGSLGKYAGNLRSAKVASYDAEDRSKAME